MSLLIDLEHSIEEINLILLALAKRPFEEVNDLIIKIRTNAAQQISVAQGIAPVADPAPEAAPELASDVSVL